MKQTKMMEIFFIVKNNDAMSVHITANQKSSRQTYCTPQERVTEFFRTVRC